MNELDAAKNLKTQVVVRKSGNWPALIPPPVYGSAEPLSLVEVFGPLRRRWLMVVAFTVIGTLAVLLYGMKRPHVYKSVAQLEIEGVNEDFLNLRELASVTADHELEPLLQTQLKVLASPPLMQAVADKLDLQNNPEYKTKASWWSALSGKKAAGDREQVLQRLAQQVTARVSGQSHIIEITAKSNDPALASALANTLAREYVDFTITQRIHNARNLTESLSTHLEDLRANLDRSESSLQDYARKAGLVDLSETNPNSVAEQSLQTTQSALAKAREDRILEQTRYERAVSSPIASLPEVLDDPTLRSYVEKIADLRRQDSELGATLKPTHYKVQEIRAQIASLEKEMLAQRDNILGRIKNQYNSARNAEMLADRAYSAQRDQAAQQAFQSIHYTTLKRDVETNRQLYEQMREKVKEAAIASEVRAANAHILSEAPVPTEPVEPVLPLYAGVGLTGGLFSGIALALLRKDRPRIQNAYQLSRQMGVPQLGAICRSMGEDSEELDAAIRQASANMFLSCPPGGYPRIIAVTSAQPGEGKSTVACSFAIALAQTNQKVLLVDAHLARPRQHSIFGAPNIGGFGSLLEHIGVRNVPHVYDETGTPGLFLLTAGQSTPAIASRLYSPKLYNLFDAMRDQFDMIVIDAPPLSDLSSRPLMRVAEGVVMVLDGRGNAPEKAAAAMERLAEDGTHVVGTIFNRGEMRTPKSSWIPFKFPVTKSTT